MSAQHTLEDAIAAVTAGLADAERAAGNWSDDPMGWHRRHAASVETLAERLRVDFSARIKDRISFGYEDRVSMLGIHSSSTSGLAGALRNWRVAAEKRLSFQQEKQGRTS